MTELNRSLNFPEKDTPEPRLIISNHADIRTAALVRARADSASAPAAERCVAAAASRTPPANGGEKRSPIR